MNFNLAQLNIAKMLAPLDDPVMADFVDNTDSINALAEQSDGFVWRLKEDIDYEKAEKVFEDSFWAINMSVWKNKESLFKFTYNSRHVAIMKRKNEWFSKIKEMHMVLWYIPVNHIPTAQEAKQRLDYIRTHGETPYAFSFKSKFTVEEFKNYKVITL